MSSPKYARTFHLPWSPGGTHEDKRAASVSQLLNVPIVISEKMDGSNTSLEHDGCYARTHAGAPTHPSFDGLKALHASVKWAIPTNLQIFGEWCFARHSIAYDALPGYFLMFGIRALLEAPEDNFWYTWQEVEDWANQLALSTVPILFKGQVSSEKELKDLTEELAYQSSACGGVREGVVVRVAGSFADAQFGTCMAKWVRKDHVQTSEHWKDQEIVRNKLKL